MRNSFSADISATHPAAAAAADCCRLVTEMMLGLYGTDRLTSSETAWFSVLNSAASDEEETLGIIGLWTDAVQELI